MFPSRKFQRSNTRTNPRGSASRNHDSTSRALSRTCTPITNVYREGLNSVILPSRRGPAGVYRPISKVKNNDIPPQNSQIQRFAGKTLPSLRKTNFDINPFLPEEKLTGSIPKYLSERKSRSFSKVFKKSHIVKPKLSKESTIIKSISAPASNNSSDIETDSKSDFVDVTEDSVHLSSEVDLGSSAVTRPVVLTNFKKERDDSATTAPIAAFRKISDRQLIQLQKNKLGSFATLEDQLGLEHFCKQKEVLQAEYELNFIKSQFGYISSSDSDASTPNAKRYKMKVFNESEDKVVTGSEPSTEQGSLFSCLYIKWSDGEYIKLVCPQCGRMDFDTYEEFSSHLKERHDVKYSDIYSASISCGVKVLESEVPANHPCQSPENVLQSQPEIRRKILCDSSAEYSKFNEARCCLEADKPRIKVYDDVVDFDSIPPASGPGTRSDRSVVKRKNIVRVMDSVPANGTGSLDPAKSIFGSRPKGIFQTTEKYGVSSHVDLDNFQNPADSIVGANLSIMTYREETPNPFDVSCVENELNTKFDIDQFVTPVSLQSDGLEFQDNEIDLSPKVERGKDSSISAQFGFDFVSRFHIKKSIVIGNTSKLVVEEPGASPHYRWLIFVTGPLYVNFRFCIHLNLVKDPDITGFVSSVKFILHPSYAPNDVIEVKKAPFILPGYGWGEFPVRAQLFFSDPRNKTIELIHNLTLCDVDSDSQDQISNTSYEIELDKDTDFCLSNIKSDRKSKDDVASTLLDHQFKGTEELPSGLMALPPTLADQHSPVLNGTILHATIQKSLIELIHTFPIISDNLDYTSFLPYKVLKSQEQFRSLERNQKQLLEWHRSKIVLECLKLKIDSQSTCPLDSELVAQFTVQQVLSWCRYLDPVLLPLQKQETSISSGIYAAKYNVCQGCFTLLSQEEVTCKACAVSVERLNSFSIPEPILKMSMSPLSLGDHGLSYNNNSRGSSPFNTHSNEAFVPIDNSVLEKNHALSIIKPTEVRFIRDTVNSLQLPCFPARPKKRDRAAYFSLALATRLFLNKLLDRVLSKAAHSEPSSRKLLLSPSETLKVDLDSNSRHNMSSNNETTLTLSPMHVWEALVPYKSNSLADRLLLSRESSSDQSNHTTPPDDPLDFLTNAYLGAVA